MGDVKMVSRNSTKNINICDEMVRQLYGEMPQCLYVVMMKFQWGNGNMVLLQNKFQLKIKCM